MLRNTVTSILREKSEPEGFQKPGAEAPSAKIEPATQ